MVEMIDKKICVDALKAIKHGLWEIDIPSPGNCPEYKEHHKQIQEMIGVVNNWISILNTIPSYILSDDKAECLEDDQKAVVDTKVVGFPQGDYEVFCCPECKTVLDPTFNYCPGCGKAMKWND